MTDEDRHRLDFMYDYLIQPTGPGRTSRAEELDKLLAAVSAGRMGARALLWLAGAIIAVSTAYAAIRSGAGQ